MTILNLASSTCHLPVDPSPIRCDLVSHRNIFGTERVIGALPQEAGDIRINGFQLDSAAGSLFGPNNSSAQVGLTNLLNGCMVNHALSDGASAVSPARHSSCTETDLFC